MTTEQNVINMNADDMQRMNRVLRHRLRNFASGIKSTITLLSSELDDRLQPSEKEYFPLILNECMGVSDLTNRFNLLFDEIPPGGPARLSECLEYSRALIQQRFPMSSIDMRMDEPLNQAVISGDGYIKLILQELIINAIESAREKPINVELNIAADLLVIKVEDQGDGSEESDLQEMVKPFFTRRARHLGIGLTAVQKVVEHLEGTLTMALRDEGGLVVEVELPVGKVIR